LRRLGEAESMVDMMRERANKGFSDGYSEPLHLFYFN
jgi:hypothetical protein